MKISGSRRFSLTKGSLFYHSFAPCLHLLWHFSEPAISWIEVLALESTIYKISLSGGCTGLQKAPVKVHGNFYSWKYSKIARQGIRALKKEHKESRALSLLHYYYYLSVKDLLSLYSFIVRENFWSCLSATDVEMAYLQHAKGMTNLFVSKSMK